LKIEYDESFTSIYTTAIISGLNVFFGAPALATNALYAIHTLTDATT
jgi:hypothetical protein